MTLESKVILSKLQSSTKKPDPSLNADRMLAQSSSCRLPIVSALVAQLLALAITIFLIIAFPTLAFSIFEWAIVQGMISATISQWLNMAAWWILIHFIFMPALIATLALGLFPLWYGVAFLLLQLIFGKIYQTQTPFYLSSPEVVHALATLLPEQHHFSFIDLGCGGGGLINNLSKIHSNGRYDGIEAAFLPFLIGKIRKLIFNSNYKIEWGNFWDQNLRHYDVVYAYLSPVPMASLWHKACQEMRPGTIFISNTFIIPGVIPEKCLKLEDFSGSTLYLWRI